MKTLEILGKNRFDTYTKTRICCRAVIIRENKILLSHEKAAGWWLIPGGGLEDGETPEECVVREAEEETGLIVRPIEQFLTIHEYYEEYRYTSHYYLCEAAGEGQMRLTDAEKNRGLVPEWLPLQDAAALFSKHESYAAVSEEKRGAYQREYTALLEYMNYLPERTLPENIFRSLDGKAYVPDHIGLSGSKIMIFEDSVLKIVPRSMEREGTVRMMKWLEGKIPVPKVIACERDDEYQYFLMSRISGQMSCDEYFLEHPAELLDLLARALKMLWRVDISDCIAGMVICKQTRLRARFVSRRLLSSEYHP